MPRRPAADERLVVPPRSGATNERVYILDLAQFLRIQSGQIVRLAKRWGFYRYKYYRPQLGPVAWVSPYGAMRIIAYIRACQGEMYLQGYDWWGIKERNSRRPSGVQRKSLANLGAGAEAKPDERSGVKGESGIAGNPGGVYK